MTMHGFYNDTTKDYYYDIALIELEKEADINNYVQTVPMVTSKKDTFNRHDICYIAGWGNIIGSVFDIQMSDYLQQSRMTVLSLDECRATYGDGIIETQICVQSHHSSACLGDSGSPLVCASGQIWMLVGIASWVGSSTCSPSYPSVYTRISSFEHWVRSVMGQAEYY
ncbi:Chymotrypsinogen B [Mactra antiquata]